jgi:hypothetical protein
VSDVGSAECEAVPLEEMIHREVAVWTEKTAAGRAHGGKGSAVASDGVSAGHFICDAETEKCVVACVATDITASAVCIGSPGHTMAATIRAKLVGLRSAYQKGQKPHVVNGNCPYLLQAAA